MQSLKPVKTIRAWLALFIACMFLSGLSAMPVERELAFLSQFFPPDSPTAHWIGKIGGAYADVDAHYPFLLYGYDWLAFAHFMLAILFIGPFKDPYRNIWVVQFGLLASSLILPFAFVAGHFRGIPVWWRVIDCSFGVVGFLVLWICLRKIKNLSPDQEYSITQ